MIRRGLQTISPLLVRQTVRQERPAITHFVNQMIRQKHTFPSQKREFSPQAMGIAPESSIHETIIGAPFVSGEGGVVLCDGIIGKLDILYCEIGQDVTVDEVIATIETDKAAVDVKARNNGTVTKIHVKLGEDIIEGQPICTIMMD